MADRPKYDQTYPPSTIPTYETGGVGVSAQPTFLQKMMHMFGSATDPGMGPQALETPIAGMVLNSKNAEVIKNAIMGLRKDASPLEIATRFVSTKYPRLSGLANQIVRNLDTTTGSLGSFDQGSKTINIFKDSEQDLPNLVNTIGHELTHAAQFKRTPGIFNNYVMPEVSHDLYSNQPAEILAKQGGSTAENSLRKFATGYFPEPTDDSSDITNIIRAALAQHGRVGFGGGIPNILSMPNIRK